MEIQITNDQNKTGIGTEKIESKARIILNALDSKARELSILLTNDKTIAGLNSDYRDIDKPTNVLSFPMEEGMFPEITPHLLGDVVISVETAKREAMDSGVTLDERLSQLLIHGVLHLLGYDHEEGTDALTRMETKSLELLKLIENNPDLSFF